MIGDLTGASMLALLLLICVVSLLMIPLGLPGTWVMVLAGMAVIWLSPAAPIGWTIVFVCFGIAVVGEILEFVISAGYTKKYGGSNRGAWGALLGGFIGAVVGVPVPVIGSVIGAFVGAFVGAMVMEFSKGATTDAATRAATGATIGRAIAIALKVAAGCVIAVLLIGAAIL